MRTMRTLSRSSLVSSAGSYIGLGADPQVTPGNRGQVVEHFLRSARAASISEWSTAFVQHAGYWAHYDHRTGRSSWPLPPVADCNELAAFALERNVLAQSVPAFGDIFLQQSPATGLFVRAGIVVGVTGIGSLFAGKGAYVECDVIEGNSSLTGALGGTHVVRLTRRISLDAGDRIVRWTALGARVARQVARELVLDRAA
jgi:hypothetical protein